MPKSDFHMIDVVDRLADLRDKAALIAAAAATANSKARNGIEALAYEMQGALRASPRR